MAFETEGVCLRNSGNSAEREASRELPGGDPTKFCS